MGHSIGDALLKAVGVRLKSCLRQVDTVARLGGDEFVLILPEINSRDAAGILATKLLETIRPTFMIEDKEVKITLSIGVSLFPENGVTVEMFVKRADEALYLAKNSGRDCYQYYS